MTTRIAMRVAYLGDNYHGFQRQPDVKTVEGIIINVLKDLEIIRNEKEANLGYSGRTDRGVHALAQVIAFDTENERIALPRVLNKHLPDDIWVWQYAKVDKGFAPRREAEYREYRYILCVNDNLDISKMRQASKNLVGTHDFANFIIKGKDLNGTIQSMDRIDIRAKGDYIVLDFKARYFQRCLIRKVVSALVCVGKGEKDEERLIALLDPEKTKVSVEPAPAVGLILIDVEYPKLNFTEELYSKESMLKSLMTSFHQFGTKAEALKSMIERFS